MEVPLDKNFNLDSTEVDFLFPFAVKKQGPNESTWFVQPGFVANSDSYYEGRNFTHIGVGYRAKNEDVFYGLNAFYDYDTDRHHKRASVGVEYGLSNIKLAGNFYFPLSQWKDSHDQFSSLDSWFFMERPARGVDVDVSGYLPDFPWLSLSANYQQFFGDTIEVSTGGDPIKDPYHLAVALNYQPVPLLTFNAGYSREKGGEKGLSVGASVTYVFGVPFEQQINPGEVGISKSLDAQLFKLVERDHNIRLEYRKKEPTFTARFTQSQYEVMEGSENNLSNWLIFSNPSEVASTHFSGTAVTTVPVGRGIVQIDQVDYFHAPAYQRQTRADSNQYQLTGNVTLKNGQMISIPPVVIMVKPSEIIASLVERGSPVEADGEAFVLVTATIEDAEHHPLSGQTVAFPEIPNMTIVDEGSSTTDSNGQVTKKVTCSKAGTYSVVAEFHEQSRSVDVVFSDRPSLLSGDLSDTYSSMAERGSPALADGTAPVTITVTLKNDYDNPVAGQAITFPEVSGLTITAKNTTTDDHGQVSATVTSTKAGTYSVSAESNGQTRSVDVTFRANPATADITNADSSVTVNKNTAVADGTDVIVATVTLKDAYGNAVSGETVTFPAVNDLTITEQVTTTDEQGQVMADITSTVSGTYTLSAEYGGKTRSVAVTFAANAATADITNDHSSLEQTGSPAVADGIASITVIATLKDADGNPVAGQTITFPEVAGLILTEHDATTDVNGQVVASVTSILAGNYTVQAEYNGKVRSVDVVFIANTATADITNDHSSVTEIGSPALADATDAVTVTATLSDADGNPVSGETVTFPAVAGLTFTKQSTTTDAQGQVVAKVTSTVAGTYSVIAEHQGKSREVSLTFITNPATADITNDHSSVTETGSPVLANGTSVVRVTATLKDDNGNPVPNKAVTFPAVDGLTITEQSSTTNTEGQVVASVTSTRAGEYTVAVEYNGKTRPVNITFNADPATADITNTFSSVVERGSPALADGTAFITVIATLKDAYDNPVPDQTIVFPTVAGLTIKEQTTITNAAGQVAACFSSTVEGNYAVPVDFKGKNRSVNISFTDNPDTADITNAHSSVTVTGSPAIADGRAVITVTATLMDAHGNPVPNENVVFPAVPGLTITEKTTTTDHRGQVVAAITSIKSGNYKVAASYKDKTRPVDIVFTANPDTASLTNTLSSVSETGSPAIANGVMAVVVTATLTDANGNPVPDQAVTFPAVAGLDITAKAARTDVNGEIMAEVTSTHAASYTMAAEYKGESLSVDVTFNASVATARITSLDSDGSPALADGSAAIRLVATLKDAKGNPVAGQSISFPVIDGLTITERTSTTDANGQVFANVTSTRANTYGVMADYKGDTMLVNISFTANAGTAAITNSYSTVTESGSPAVADGADSITVTATLKDDNGNPVSGQVVTFSKVAGLNISEQAESTNAYGQVTAKVTSTRAGSYTVAAEYQGKTRAVDVTFDADPATASISRVAESGSPALADGTAAITITATVQDADGNPLPGQRVTFSKFDGISITETSQTTDAHGQIIAQVTSTQAGNYEIKAELNGVMKSVNVTFNANPETASITSIVESGSPSSADGTDGIVVTATLTDAKGNPVPGQTVTFPPVEGLTIIEHVPVTNSDGWVTASITSKIAGTYRVSADYKGNTQSIDLVFKANQATANIVSLLESGSPASADGRSVIKVIATIKDSEGNPVPSQMVSFLPVEGIYIKGIRSASNSEGQVVVDITGIKAGTYKVTAEYKGKALSKDIRFEAGPPQSLHLSTTRGDVFADDLATKLLTAHVADADGNPVSDVEVHFGVPDDSGATLSKVSVITNGDGQAIVSIKGSSVGTVPVTAQMSTTGTRSIELATANVIFVPGPPVQVMMSATSNNIYANDVETGQVIAQVVDSFMRPVSGIPVNFIVTGNSGAKLEKSLVNTGSDGKALTTIRSPSVGAVIIQGVINTNSSGSPVEPGAISVNFVAGPATKVTLDSMSDGIYANGHSAHNVTASVVDASDRPVADVSVTFSIPAGMNAKLAASNEKTNTHGKAGTSISATAGGEIPVTATISTGGHTTSATRSASFNNFPVVTVRFPQGPLLVGNPYPLIADVTNVAGIHYPGVQVNFSAPPDSGVFFQESGFENNAWPIANSEGIAKTTILVTEEGTIPIDMYTWLPGTSFTMNFEPNPEFTGKKHHSPDLTVREKAFAPEILPANAY